MKSSGIGKTVNKLKKENISTGKFVYVVILFHSVILIILIILITLTPQ